MLARRLRRRNDRPLLKTADPVATLAALLAEREPVRYGKADVTVLSRDTAHDVIVGEIIAAICNRLGVSQH